MYRIDNDTNAAALPASTAVGPNPDGYFTEGDPGGAVPATDVPAEWLNMVQEELANVITGAGGALDKTDTTQLYAAIQSLITAGLPTVTSDRVFISGAAFDGAVGDGDAVYWDGAQFAQALADGSAADAAIGLADVSNGEVTLYGEHSAGLAGLTSGARQYLSAAAAGALVEAAPSDVVTLGIARSADTVFVDPDRIASPVFTTSFISSDQAITLSSTITIAHGLGAAPRDAWVRYRCVTAEAGYSVGDVANGDGSSNDGNPGSNQRDGITVSWDATNLYLSIGSALATVNNKSSPSTNFNLTLANWNIYAEAVL